MLIGTSFVCAADDLPQRRHEVIMATWTCGGGCFCVVWRRAAATRMGVAAAGGEFWFVGVGGFVVEDHVDVDLGDDLCR